MSNVWDTISPFIGKYAPMLGAALSPVCPLAGIAGAALGSALGIKDGKPEDIAKAISSGSLTGDQIVAVRQAEIAFQEQMKAMDIASVKDIEAIYTADLDSARKRQIALGDKTPQALVYMALATWGIFNGILLFMAFHGKSLPTDMVGIIMRVLGTMDALLGMGFSYFLGAKHGDMETKQMLYKSTPADSSTQGA